MSDMDEGDRLGDKAYSDVRPAVLNPGQYPEDAEIAAAHKSVELAVERRYSGNDPRTKGQAGSGEVVEHPSHYTFGKYEVIDVIYDWQPPYPLDNVIKYVARAGKKGGPDKELEDLKKAQFYLNYYIAEKEKSQ